MSALLFGVGVQYSTKLILSTHTHQCKAFIDAGSEQNFFDQSLAKELNHLLILLSEPLQVFALNGAKLTQITHHTQAIQLFLSGNHVVKLVSFCLTQTTNNKHHLRRCRHLWRSTQAAFLRISEQNKKLPDCHRTVTPPYTQGQNVWLSTKNVPLRTESKKLAPHFIGPFDIMTMINPVTARLNLTQNMKIHNIFHVSQLKSVRFSSLDR